MRKVKKHVIKKIVKKALDRGGVVRTRTRHYSMKENIDSCSRYYIEFTNIHAAMKFISDICSELHPDKNIIDIFDSCIFNAKELDEEYENPKNKTGESFYDIVNSFLNKEAENAKDEYSVDLTGIFGKSYISSALWAQRIDSYISDLFNSLDELDEPGISFHEAIAYMMFFAFVLILGSIMYLLCIGVA